jgi:hypothetical protein
MRTVERCANPSAEEIRTRSRNGAPVVFTGVVDRWPARQRWSSPSAFAERAGDITVPLIHLPRGGTDYYPDVEPVPMPLSACLQRIFGNSGDRYYLSQVELLDSAPNLAEDFSFPTPDPDATYEPVYFWIGTGGCVSRLHFDLAHNFACQIVGSRRFRLYPPSESHRLYPSLATKFSPASTLGDTSRERYPLFEPDRFIEVQLRPGDLLFLPGFWWHQVITDEPGIMITRFWNTPQMVRDRQRLPGWAALVAARQFAAASAATAELETAAYQNVLRAATTREALRAGDRDAAQHALGLMVDPEFVDAIRELFDPANTPASAREPQQ